MADIADAADIIIQQSMDEQRYQIEKRRREEEEARKTLSRRKCKECGLNIPMKRLRAVPQTQLCATCQAEAEEQTAHAH